MKPSHLLILLPAIGLSCTSSQTASETVASDSSAQVASTQAVPVSSSTQTVEIIDNFPGYESGSTLSEDELESQITAAVDQMIAANTSVELLSYKTYYKRQRTYEGEHEEVTEETEKSEAWYFDKSFQLVAHYIKSSRDGEGRESSVTISILQGDSAIAYSDYGTDDGQIGVRYHTKMLRSNCPRCGFKSEAEADGPGKLVTLGESDMINFSQELTEIEVLVDMKVWDKPEQGENGYVIFENLGSWTDGVETYANPYTVEHAMDEALYNYLLFRNMVEQFVSGNSDGLPSAAVELYFAMPEEYTSYRPELVLESESVYFFIYNKFKAVGGGSQECFGVTFTKQGELISNVLLGSSYEATGPDEPAEDYDYKYDSDKRVLHVTEIKTSAEGEKTEKKYDYKLLKDGTIADPVLID
jgi:hypothetical protein